MKRIFILVMIILLWQAVHAQSEIPAQVKSQFNDEFVSAMNVSWSLLNGAYTVNFYHQSHHKTAIYLVDGSRVYTQTKLYSLSQVPVKVSNTFLRRYSNYFIQEKVRIDGVASTDVLYVFDVHRNEKHYRLQYNEKGKLVTRKNISPFAGHITKN